MAAQAQLEGRFLGGRPPYGYALGHAGPHPNPSKAADDRRLHQLEREGIPSPSAHDPARNPHRSGIAWSKGAVRAILKNPRYTGRQVWNRQPKTKSSSTSLGAASRAPGDNRPSGGPRCGRSPPLLDVRGHRS